ncbi:hypothetical protein [Changpingibacter yushuensis]|uniref:hypothetical protein n=1 Tax=Changpingibacter yushuensis TaxID=2758440 RepID=UPI0015F3A98C|nr:hypothetical protein [Changpingibacter yushuensis]
MVEIYAELTFVTEAPLRAATEVIFCRNVAAAVKDRLAGGSRPGFVFGRSSDQLVAGDWFGSGSDTLAAYRK